MTRPYAAGTPVEEHQSKVEIERLLERAGATRFGYAWEDGEVVILFTLLDRSMRLAVTMPVEADFRRNGRGLLRTNAERVKAYRDERRRRWRVLKVMLTAQIEAVRMGMFDRDEVFLPYLVQRDGVTVFETVQPTLGARLPALREGA